MKPGKGSFLGPRRLFQLFVFIAFAVSISLARDPLVSPQATELFYELDPFIALLSIVATRAVTAGLLLCLATVAVTVLFGRLFCGYFCPLGTALDGADAAATARFRGKPEQTDRGRLRPLKHFLFAASAAAAAAGVLLSYVIDPIVLLSRAIIHFVYPVWMLCGGLFLDAARPLGRMSGALSVEYADLARPLSSAAVFSLAIFAAVAAANVLSERFFCRYVCPLGAMLGLLSKAKLFSRRVNAACDDCGVCQARCPMAAIPANARDTRVSECVTCYGCVRVCPKDAVSFGFGGQAAVSGKLRDPDMSRGLATAGIASGLLLAAGFRVNLKRPASGVEPLPLRSGKLIRPPGALPEHLLVSSCIRCGNCVKVCPTNTILPCWLDAGPEGLWTPGLALRYAPCNQTCNLCGRVCPTGAIRDLPIEEKKHAKIGTAWIVRDRCLAWTWDVRCLICDEQCPYNAVVFRPLPGARNRVPYVNRQKCNGCGQCEDKCPVSGDSAIIVDPTGELRLERGSYVAEAKSRGLVFQARERLSDELSPEGGGPELPPGFIF